MTRRRSLLPRLGLGGGVFLTCLAFRTVGAGNADKNIALTLAPAQYSAIESFQITVPVMVETVAQVSMVTMTQMSVQTTTVMSTVPQMVTQKETVTMTVSGTCAAAAALQSTKAVEVDIIPASSPKPSSAAVSAAAPMLSQSAPGPCDCQCLCPMMAFMASNKSVVTAEPSKQISSFQTVGTSTTGVAPTAAGSGSTASTTDLGGSAGAASSNVVATSQMTSTTSAPSLVQTAGQGGFGGVSLPFNINTYSLQSAVKVSINARAAPTGGSD